MNPNKVIKKITSKRGNQVIFRTPKMDDLEGITEMMNSIILEDDFILMNELIKLEEEKIWLKNTIKKNKTGKSLYFLAENEGEIVGSVHVEGGRGRVSHVGTIGIAVKNGFREEGIGTELLKTIITKAQDMNLKTLKLEVYETNKRAHSLYLKLGFKEFGRLPNEIKVKNELINGIYMYKELV
jgi:RimJ/RimL family protein N-acetyltransferase